MGIKYTDEDVRAAPERMRKAAVEYLRAYEGDFHVLVGLQESLATGQLTTAQIRKTLNCMIHDSAATLPTMLYRERPAPPVPRFPRPLAVRWRKVLGYSTYSGKARRLHMLNQDESEIRYNPKAGRWDGAFSVRMRWICSDMTSRNAGMVEGIFRHNYATQLISAEEAFKLLDSGEGWTLCKTCSKVLRGRLERSK